MGSSHRHGPHLIIPPTMLSTTPDDLEDPDHGDDGFDVNMSLPPAPGPNSLYSPSAASAPLEHYTMAMPTAASRDQPATQFLLSPRESSQHTGSSLHRVFSTFKSFTSLSPHQCLDNSNRLHELTSKTGSLMYMAPEVYKGLPYNCKVRS